MENTNAIPAGMVEVVKSMHPWERAGLGVAPFRYIGSEKSVYVACPGANPQPGSSCDYCGQGIMYVCHIMSADGKRFKVGCDCVGRLNRKDNSPADKILISKAEAAAKAHAKAIAKARDAAKLEELAGIMRDATAEAALDALPHPRGFAGKSFANYAGWMFANAGIKGKLALLKEIKTALGR